MITVFTPAYNRADTLPRLFESLKRQTDKDFEWIIIDDDSKDSTSELIDNFLTEKCGFEITYKKQQHGGKHRAFNKAVKMAKGNWSFCVDSDDYLSDDAIEKFHFWIARNEDDEKIGIISGSRFDTGNNKALSVPKLLTDNPGFKCLNYERDLYDLDSDRAEIYRTELLCTHPFPEFENEYFVTEGAVWDRIALDGFYTVFYPDVVYFNEYLETGLTKTGANSYKGFFENFNGFLYFVKTQIQAKGISVQTYFLLETVFRIAGEKRVGLDFLSEKLDLQKTELQRLKHLKSVYFFFRCFRKAVRILESRIKI